jgi:hypothetical protein
VSSLDELRAHCRTEITAESYYEQYHARGIAHGDSFQAITQLWQESGSAVARLQVPLALRGHSVDFCLHPVLLDAAFQVLQAALVSHPEVAHVHQQATFLPSGLERLQRYQTRARRIVV